jgi:hypothetical protein
MRTLWGLKERVRVRVRGNAGLYVTAPPLIRPSATFSPGEKGFELIRKN